MRRIRNAATSAPTILTPVQRKEIQRSRVRPHTVGRKRYPGILGEYRNRLKPKLLVPGMWNLALFGIVPGSEESPELNPFGAGGAKSNLRGEMGRDRRQEEESTLFSPAPIASPFPLPQVASADRRSNSPRQKPLTAGGRNS